MRLDNAWIQHKNGAKRNIKFRSLELIKPKVRTSHSGEEWEKNSISEKKKGLEDSGSVGMSAALF